MRNIARARAPACDSSSESDRKSLSSGSVVDQYRRYLGDILDIEEIVRIVKGTKKVYVSLDELQIDR